MKTLQLNRIIISIFALLSTIFTWGMNNDLIMPRVGDKYTAMKLSHTPNWCDSTATSPDLRNIAFSQSKTVSMWAPSSCDSVSSLLIIKGNETEYIMHQEEAFFRLKRVRPGMSRQFDSCPLYIFSESCEDVRHVTSHGTTDDIGDFATVGEWRNMPPVSCLMITANSDTLYNVSCFRTDINEKLIYNKCDTSVFVGTSRFWYAPGYRYPLLSHESGIMYTIEGDTIDAVSEWYYISPEELVDNIVDDPINELIRTTNADSETYKNEPHYLLTKKSSSIGDNKRIRYDSQAKRFTITSSFDNDKCTAYIIVDISGIVYAGGTLSADRTTISTEGLRPGTYVLALSTTGDNIAYKFKLNGDE